MKRKGEGKPFETIAKFDCRVPGGGVSPELGHKNVPKDFSITPDKLSDDPKSGVKVPRFNFAGQISSTNCCFDEPFDGYLMLKESEIMIKSIEI